MQPQEKKYRVKSLAPIFEIIRQKNLTHIKHVTSVHYYGEHTGKDVEKFVEYPDRIEVHTLKETDGKFTLVDHFSLPDKNAGFAWLKEKGYKTANIVTMEYDEYAYENGVIGTYLIDGFLPSIILYCPPSLHDTSAKMFDLDHAEVITVPYDTYLSSLGRLRSIPLG